MKKTASVPEYTWGTSRWISVYTLLIISDVCKENTPVTHLYLGVMLQKPHLGHLPACLYSSMLVLHLGSSELLTDSFTCFKRTLRDSTKDYYCVYIVKYSEAGQSQNESVCMWSGNYFRQRNVFQCHTLHWNSNSRFFKRLTECQFYSKET